METEEDILIQKYQILLYNHEPVYFDIYEFEIIISHYIYIGECYDALEALFHAKLCHPDNNELDLFKVEIFICLDELEKALILIEEIETRCVDSYKVPFLKGQIYVACEDVDAAMKQFRAVLKNAANMENGYSNPDMLDIPCILMEEEYYSQALYFLHLLIIHNSENVEILCQMASCYKNIEKLDKAEKYYDKALDIDPFNPETWTSLGTICLDRKNYEKALSCCEFALAINEKHCNAICCKTDVLIAMEEYGKAIACINEFLANENGTDKAPFLYTLAECYLKILDEEKAIDCYYKAIEVNSNYPMPYWGLAKILYSCDDFQLAARLIEKALEHEPDNWNYIYLKGLCTTGLGAESFDTHKFLELLKKGKSLNEIHKVAMTLYYFGDLENCCKFLLNAASSNASSIEEFFKHIPEAKNDAFIINYLGKYLK